MTLWYVIEGPDQTGKTSLAKSFEARGFIYQKATAIDRLPILMARMARLIHANVVWDRAHVSEEVHHPDRVDPEWAMAVDALLDTIPTRGILLTRRVGPPEDYENTPDMHEELVSAFRSRAAWSPLHWYYSLSELRRDGIYYDEKLGI